MVTATCSSAPRVEIEHEAQLTSLLHGAAARVFAETSASGLSLREGFDAAGGAAALSVLVDETIAGLRGAPAQSLLPHPWLRQGPRLLSGLRRELLAVALESPITPTAIIRVLQQFELLAHQLDADLARQTAEQELLACTPTLLVELAHDMRSPLSSIQFLVERMRCGQTGPVSPMQERHLGLVHSAAFGLSALTSDLMELAQGCTRLVGRHVVEFSIGEVLHAVRDVVQPVAEEKSITLRCSALPDDRRHGHPAALHRVLLNLVTNALKYTNAGMVSVDASLCSQTAVRFLVSDTGRGMPPAVLSRLSGGLPRADAESDAGSGFSSTGLGLAICQRLVSAMGGELAVLESGVTGTRIAFTLDLPVDAER